jgi:protein-S-isoprenylcysteine O-methyltransferase Ste14
MVPYPCCVSLVIGTVVALLGGFAMMGLSHAVARRRPESEVQPVREAVLGLLAAMVGIAVSAHVMVSHSRGVGVFLALWAIVCILLAIHSLFELRAVRSQESGRESQSARD